MVAPSAPLRFGRLVQHDTLWFVDGNIVLAADYTVFKVHRGLLCRESPFFSDLLECQPPEGIIEGTEARPLAVLEVSGQTMCHILNILYTPWGSDDLKLDTDAYMDVLKAAHRLQFNRIWKIAHGHLSQNLSAVKKLHLVYSQCGDLNTWALPAYRELIADAHSVSDEEHGMLSKEVWRVIWRTRDNVWAERTRVEHQLLSYRAANNDQLSPRLCDEHLLDLLTSWTRVPLFPDNTTHVTQIIGVCKSCSLCATRGSGGRPSLGELMHSCLTNERRAVQQACNSLKDA